MGPTHLLNIGSHCVGLLCTSSEIHMQLPSADFSLFLEILHNSKKPVGVHEHMNDDVSENSLKISHPRD